jgi:hypothetical protein
LARLVLFRRRIVKLHGALFAACVVTGGLASARAEPDARAEARAHYERGIGLAERSAYEEALAEFRRAYERSPHFAVLYNIGLCHVGLERPADAATAFRRYLAEGGGEIPPERRAEVEARLASIESRFAELTITADRAGTVVAVDGKEIGRTPLAHPVRVPAGVHEITATLDGVPVLNRRLELAEAERRTIDFAFAASPLASPPPLAMAPAPASPPPENAGPRNPAKADTTGPWHTAGFVLAGAGVAAGIGGVVHYAWNRERHADWEAEQARLTAEPPPLDYRERAAANNELADSIERASAVTVGLFVASGALVAGGLALVVVDPSGGAKIAWSGTW